LLKKIGNKSDGVELGIGDSLLFKAVSESSGKTLKQIREAVQKQGDIGKAMMDSKSNQKMLMKPKILTISHVYKTFQQIAMLQGKSSQEKKIGRIKELLVNSTGYESLYIVKY
jgi:DNA ligase-1